MYQSMDRYNHMNQSDISKRLIMIDSELESEDIKSMKFLCQDHIPPRTLERMRDGIQIFNELKRMGKIYTTRGDDFYLLECFYRCHRMDLVGKMGSDRFKVKIEVENGRSNFSPFRILLFEIAEEMESTDLKTALFSLSTIIPRSKHERITSLYDVFIHLERTGDLSPHHTDVLIKLLQMLERGDLITKVRNYSGITPTGFNTELGYGPVDEGYPVRHIEIVGPVDQGASPMEPSYQPEQPIVPSPHPQTIHFQGNQLPITAPNQIQSSCAFVPQGQQGVMDIRSHGQNKNGAQIGQMSERVRQMLKQEDRQNDRVVPSRQTNEELMSINAQQEQPSLDPQTPVSESPRGDKIQTIAFPAQRTGFSIQTSANHLVPRNDTVIEEQSPGDSGLTAGTVSLSDESSQGGTSSGDVVLSISESLLMQLSEIINKHNDFNQLACELGIDSTTMSNIIQSSPTNQIRIYRYMHHWLLEEKQRTRNCPSAEGLLKAFRNCGYNDAIQMYVRHGQDPESVSEPESQNLPVQSAGNEYHENFNVSSGEAQVSQSEDMDVQGPAIHRVYSNSDAQVGPSLNPSINHSIQQQNRQDDAVLRQMEIVTIDDTAMPYYKMDARPRGLAIIINNQHFHKVRDDSTSKEMPGRKGTEKDAEKLEYIWRKLDFEVQTFNDVDSIRMSQIMVEVGFKDHAEYDCLVCCILTHGVLGHVYGSDGRIVRINQLTSCFSSRRCPSLAGKPKLFFIQACQGREKQEGHAIETDAAVSEPPDVTTDRPRELIPDEADFLLGYATVPGYVSYRSKSQGSWYINKLSQNLDKYAYQNDLLSILVIVNEEVGRATANTANGSYKQIPAPMFTLRKKIIFR